MLWRRPSSGSALLLVLPVVVACVWTGAVVAALLSNLDSFAVLSGALVVCTVAVIFIIRAHRAEHDAFSPLGLICLYNIATFGVGALYFYFTPWPGAFQPYAREDLAPAVGLGALGLAMLAAGYWANPLRVVAGALPALPTDVTSRRTFVVIVTLLVLGWLARLYEFRTGHYFYADQNVGPTTGSSWVQGTLAELPLVATAFCGARYYFAIRLRTVGGNSRWLYYGLVFIEFAYNAPRGSRAAIMTILLMVLILRYYGLRRWPSVTSLAAIVAVAVIVVFPLLFAYRNVDAGGGYQQNLGDSLTRSVRSLVEQSPLAAATNGAEATVRRFSGATSMAAILHYGPEASGRRPGETLSWIYTGLLPRFVAPNKPDPGRYANEFAQRFAVASPGPTTTSVSIPNAAELYLNYRILGIVFGMFAIGAVYRMISQYFIGRCDSPIALAVYAVAAWPLINSQESVIAGGVLGMIKFMAVLAITLLAVVRLQRFLARGSHPRKVLS